MTRTSRSTSGSTSTRKKGKPLQLRPNVIRTITTTTLAAVLDEVCAPAHIEYFSLDVEGSEYRVLRNFPFSRYRFSVLTIERPKEPLCLLLHRHGYRLVGLLGTFYETLWIHHSVSQALLRGGALGPLRSFPGFSPKFQTVLRPYLTYRRACQELHHLVAAFH